MPVMAASPSHRSAPTTSGACCVPRPCSDAREQFAAGAIDAARTAGGGGRAIRRRGRDAGARSACRRPPTASSAARSWHMDFIYRLGGITKTDQQIQVYMHNAAGEGAFTSAGMAVTGRIGWRSRSSPTTSRSSPRRLTTARAEADDPLAEHGLLPRRLRGDRPLRLPRPRGVLEPTSRPPTPTRCRRCTDLGCRYLQLDDTSLAYLNDPAHRADAGRQAATTPTTQHLRYIRQINAAHRGPAAGMSGHHPHVPGQLPLVLGRRGRLRPRRRGPVRRAGRRRVLLRVRRRALRRVRAAAVRAARASRWCSGWSPRRPGRSRTPTRSSGASTRHRSTCRSTSCASPRSAASPRRSRATRSRSRSRRPSCG